MVTGKWKTESNVINSKPMFAVYRIKDTSVVDHSGNREYATGYMEDSVEAHEIAEKMNNGLTLLLDYGVCSLSEEELTRYSTDSPITVEALKRLEEGNATPNQVRIEFGLDPIAENWANEIHLKRNGIK